ncbi:hypothetical protein VM1G_10103 [Cytospora mali]|uniref:Uncharacterized protein n=1 Tax=Cytospora mali TaxID=578113 RepID=A0A194WE49_CYTMA|nr:hypothetical protein VM1G_10103 [Valsa mali]
MRICDQDPQTVPVTPIRFSPLARLLTMAKPRSLDLTALEAVVTWTGTHGQTHCLSRRDNEPPTQVALDIKYKEIQGQSGYIGLFRLLVLVSFKASPLDKTPLFLYIRPERVVSLECLQSSDAIVDAKLGPRHSQHVCLRFNLNRPADMVAPSGVPLVPLRHRPHGQRMDLLMSLAQTTSFSISLDAHDLGSTSLLREFVDAIGDPATDVQSTEVDDISSLYSGQGGRILDDAELSASVPLAIPPSPPLYGNIEAPPPLAPLEPEHAAGPSSSSKSRKRRRDSDIDEASTSPSVESMVETIYHRLHHDMKGTLQQSRNEDRAFMTDLVEKAKSEIMAEIEKQKTEIKQYVDRCTDELDYRLADVEREVEDTNDRVDVQVDDAVVSYKIEVEEEKENFKSEMREFVDERLDEVQDSAVEEIEERVMERLNGAKVQVSIEQATINLE